MKYISVEGDRLILRFNYDKKIVDAVKTIDGRIWNKDGKRWEAPKDNLEEVLEALVPIGFTLSDAVQKLEREAKEKNAFIDNIKSSIDQPYNGPLPLYDFQRKGVSFLKSLPCALLADVPGLGKSIQTIGACEDQGKVLVFVPASLKYSWEAEIKKWYPDDKIIILDGNKKERLAQWLWAKDKKYKWVIANYELLLHDFDLIKDYMWPVIVCDEATRISNPDAKTVRNLKQLNSMKRYALTGTPISNKPDDIWSIIDWLIPGYLGSYYQFKNKYCVMEDESWGYIDREGNYLWKPESGR